jgi:hypothetical protein
MWLSETEVTIEDPFRRYILILKRTEKWILVLNTLIMWEQNPKVQHR